METSIRYFRAFFSAKIGCSVALINLVIPRKIMHAPGPGIYKNSLGIGVQIRQNVVISSLVFLGAYVVALAPEALDRPLTRLINSFANRSALFDGLVASLNAAYSFSGVVLMALIWSCWFDTKDSESRARILIGTLGAVAAGGVSRFCSMHYRHIRALFTIQPLLFRYPREFNRCIIPGTRSLAITLRSLRD